MKKKKKKIRSNKVSVKYDKSKTKHRLETCSVLLSYSIEALDVKRALLGWGFVKSYYLTFHPLLLIKANVCNLLKILLNIL